MTNRKDLLNKHFQLLNRKHKLEVKQFKVEQHLLQHPSDYTSVIANEKLRSEIYRVEYNLKQNKKLMEIYSYDG